MQISEISIKRPVFATVMNLVILLIGLIAYDRLSVRLIPDVDVPIVTVFTVYPGANAQVLGRGCGAALRTPAFRKARSKFSANS